MDLRTRIIEKALWVIVENGFIKKVCDENGNEVIRCTVKDSRKLKLSDGHNSLNQLDLSLFVNVAASEDEMKERMQEFQRRKTENQIKTFQ